MQLYLKYFILISFLLLNRFSALAQTPHIDSLLQALKNMKEDTTKANTLHELARAYLFELNDNQKVGEFASQQLALSQKLNFTKGIAWAYLNRAVFYLYKGELETSLMYHKKSLTLMQELGIKKGESSCYINIGLCYFNLGNYKDALDYMFKGVKMKEILNDKKGTSRGYTNIGNIYFTQGDHPRALKYQFKAIKIQEESGDKVSLSMSYNNIGNIFENQGQSENALVYYNKSLKINEALNDQIGTGNVSSNIGSIYLREKKYKEALNSYFKSLHIREAINDKKGMASSYNNIGNVYFQQKNTKLALTYQLKSFELNQKIGYKKGLVESCQGIGELYEEKGDKKNALRYYHQMLKMSEELGFKEGIRDAYSNFTALYREQKQFEKALEYNTLYNAIKDSILNKENFKQISELNLRYNIDKKEKEILILTKDQQLNAKIIKEQKLIRWGLTGSVGFLFISVFSVYRRYRFKQKANLVLQDQKREIQQKNILITDSIDYAKIIQDAVLPTAKEVQAIFPQSFMLYKPKDIVSGDFYWVSKDKDEIICATADCTGHGVPGAFMSLLGYNMLEHAIKKQINFEPAAILDDLNAEMIKSLSTGEIDEIKHGMDISLISINTRTHQLQYAGAHTSIYIIRNYQLTELKADRKAIGFVNKQEGNHFTNQTFALEKGDMIYLHTDGFPDQMGGPKRKKFYYQPFKDLLISISKLAPDIQEKALNEAYEKHVNYLKEKTDQTDDILVMGIRY